MDNFLGGFHAIILGLASTLSEVSSYPLFWGFSIGFFVSTIMHMLLLVDKPGDVSTVLFQEKSKGFEKLYAPQAGGVYTKSYAEYSKTAHRTKLLFLSAVFIVLILIVFVILTHAL